MIRIIEKKKDRRNRVKPSYTLVYNYMIGDANGQTKEEVQLSLDNPFIERYCKLLNSLKPTSGTWGIVFRGTTLYDLLREKQITKDDYGFLRSTMYESSWEDEDEDGEAPYFKTAVESNFANEFYGGVRGETEYSFLVFQGVTLYYNDEYGDRKITEFIDE